MVRLEMFEYHMHAAVMVRKEVQGSFEAIRINMNNNNTSPILSLCVCPMKHQFRLIRWP